MRTGDGLRTSTIEAKPTLPCIRSITTRRTSPGAASETNSVKPSAWARPTPPGSRRSISTSRIFSSGSAKVICSSQCPTNLSLILAAPLAHDKTNHNSADCSQNEDGHVCLCDDGIGQAQEHPEDQTIKPRGDRQSGNTKHKSDSEAIEEG